MKTIEKIWLTLALISLLIQCKPAVVQLPESGRVVVESYLMPNRPVRVKLKKAISYSEVQNYEEPIDSITILFSSRQKEYRMQSIGGGFYRMPASFQVNPGETYNLSFTYGNKQITAQTTVPYIPERFAKSVDSVQLESKSINSKIGDQIKENSSIQLTWANSDNNYYYVVVNNIETKPTPIVSAPTGQNINPFTFSSKPTQTNTIEINTAQFQYFGRHQFILIRVNPDYAQLYNSGYTNQSSPYVSINTSSIKNGLGLFTGLSADTLIFKVVKK